MPFFPKISRFQAFENYTYLKTGDHYIAEVWFFENRTEFVAGEEELVRYAGGQGALSEAVLDVSPEIEGTNNPFLMNLTTKRLPATKFDSPMTSGYFIALEQNRTPGWDGYYIGYYGVMGSSDLRETTHPIKILLVTRLSSMEGGVVTGLAPASPPP